MSMRVDSGAHSQAPPPSTAAQGSLVGRKVTLKDYAQSVQRDAAPAGCLQP